MIDAEEGDVFAVGERELEVVACDPEHGLYELRDVASTDAPAVVFAEAQLAEFRRVRVFRCVWLP